MKFTVSFINDVMTCIQCHWSVSLALSVSAIEITKYNELILSPTRLQAGTVSCHMKTIAQCAADALHKVAEKKDLSRLSRLMLLCF